MVGENPGYPRPRAAGIAFLAVCVLFVVPTPGRTQQLVTGPTGSSCTHADLDADLQFINGPGDATFRIARAL